MSLTISTPADLLDYAAHTLNAPLHGDTLTLVTRTGLTSLGTVMRLRECDAVQGAAARLRLAMTALLDSDLGQGALIFTGALAANPAKAVRVLEQTRPFLICQDAYTLHEGTWTDLTTGATGPYVPGTSNVGLHLALDA